MEGLTFTLNKGVRTIRFNNPKKRNVISISMYSKLAEILDEDSKNEEIVVTIFTGTGDFFTSGTDLSRRKDHQKMDFEQLQNNSVNGFRAWIEAILRYPKLIIAVVNGPAIGIGVTLCGICDVVYATEKATFKTPFVNLGLCIEATGSFSLPIIMGKSKANELLLLGKTFTAQEAFEANLVSRVINSNELEAFMESLSKYGELNVQSVKINKKLVADGFRKEMYDAFTREVEQLLICRRSDLFMANVKAFIARKSKL